MLNKVKVTICGREYALQTDESPSYSMGLAKRLDKQINEMVNSADNLSVAAAAVFIALSYMDEANKSTESIDNIRTQIKDYVDDAGRARLERDEIAKELEMLKTRYACLENDLKFNKLKDTLK